MSTNAPNDLKAFRTDVMAECGFTNPGEVGITGDPAHARRGGYHISGNDIRAAGRFDSDFSTKRTRDHFLPNPFASAVDIGDDWPRGGRAAWLRFNNNVLYEMIHHPGVLTTVRAINCSTDGSNKKRYDKANASQGVINSTDTVTIHTHLEFWRDTNGTAARAADLDRLIAHIRTARDGTPLDDGASTEGDDMFLRTPNGSIYLAAGGKTVSVSGAEWGSVSPQTFVNVPQSLVDKLLVPPSQVTLTPEQFADFKASTAPIVHDAAFAGAHDGLDGATIHPAVP
jgi:hypothetical protein